jgi:hypothetical protein
MQSNFKFLFFWTKFDPENNFFIDTFHIFLRDSRLGLEFDLSKLEIEFHSVFGWPRRLNPIKRLLRLWLVKIKRALLGKTIILIWYSGELGRPPKGYDLTLSYSPTLGNNVYLPVWATYTTHNIFRRKYDREFIFEWEKLLSARELRSFENNRIACTFISNPTTERLRFAQALERLGILDIYGLAVGKPIESKLNVSKDYIFQLCLENQDKDNYVTEKPFEAWMCGNIPIYKKNGTLTALNTNSFVNITDYDPGDLERQLLLLIQDQEQLNRIYREPILANPLESKEIEERFLRIAEKELGLKSNGLQRFCKMLRIPN